MSWELVFCGAVFSLFTNLFFVIFYCCYHKSNVCSRIGSFHIYFFYHYVASLVCAYFIFNPRINSGIAAGILNFSSL